MKNEKKPNVTVSQVKSILEARFPCARIVIEKKWTTSRKGLRSIWWWLFVDDDSIKDGGVSSATIQQGGLQTAWESLKNAASKKGLKI